MEGVPLPDGAPVGPSPLEVTSSFTYKEEEEEEELATATTVKSHRQSEDAAPLSTVKRRRGIVDECCYRPCSLNDLQMYCSETTTTAIPEILG